jgi:hypothetical protein
MFGNVSDCNWKLKQRDDIVANFLGSKFTRICLKVGYFLALYIVYGRVHVTSFSANRMYHLTTVCGEKTETAFFGFQILCF